MATRKQKTTERVNAQFDKRLEDYSALTRISVATSNLRSHSGNWAIYAAAVGSALAMGSNASADIIYCSSTNNYCGEANGPVVATAANNIHIPLLGTPNHQIILDASSHNFGLTATASVFGGNKIKLFNSAAFGASFLVENLNSGAAIGPGVLAGNQPQAVLGAQGFLNVVTAGTSFGNFKHGVSGFVGLQLDSVGGNTDYGWIRLIVDANGASIPSVTLVDWAVDTQNHETISAGQTVTPEPGTMGLGLLAAGAAGVAALRRRRKVSA